MLTAALLACAVGIAPATMDAVVAVESGRRELALHINAWAGPQPHLASSMAEASATARRFMATGHSVDIGLGQLNSAHLSSMRMSVEDAFDPCRNLAASGMVLSGFYAAAVQRWGEGQVALAHALSGYNSGDILSRGFLNGYVGKYYINVGLTPTTGKKPRPEPDIREVSYDRPGYEMKDMQ